MTVKYFNKFIHHGNCNCKTKIILRRSVSGRSLKYSDFALIARRDIKLFKTEDEDSYLPPLVEEFACHHDEPVGPGVLSPSPPLSSQWLGHLLLQPGAPVTSAQKLHSKPFQLIFLILFTKLCNFVTTEMRAIFWWIAGNNVLVVAPTVGTC